MSNVPSRRGVQPTAEISSRGEKAERIYLECPNDRCDELDKCNKKNRNSKFSVRSDNPNTMGRINISKHPDYPMLGKLKVGQRLG